VVAGLARAPFLTAGLSPDEGGYAYIAREWSHGAVLYRDLWIDRPQGLLGVYRGILAIADHAWAIRLGALLTGVAVALLLGAIGWMLRSPATGVAAAFVYAVVGAGPHIEGFTLNGELLAGLPSTASACPSTTQPSRLLPSNSGWNSPARASATSTTATSAATPPR